MLGLVKGQWTPIFNHLALGKSPRIVWITMICVLGDRVHIFSTWTTFVWRLPSFLLVSTGVRTAVHGAQLRCAEHSTIQHVRTLLMKKLDVEDARETVAMENSVITGMVNFRNYPPKKSQLFSGCSLSIWWFWNMNFIFPYIYREFHHPNWRTHIFQRGGSTTNQFL